MFDALKSLQPSFPSNYKIYSTYPPKCFSVNFFLYKCYQIKSKTGLWKSSIDIIKKKWTEIRKTPIRIVFPSSPLIINSLLLAKFLMESFTMLFRPPISSTTLFNPVIPKLVRNIFKKNNFCYIRGIQSCHLFHNYFLLNGFLLLNNNK